MLLTSIALVFWYFTNQGFFTTGTIEPSEDGLVVAEKVSAAAGPQQLRSVIRRAGPDSYVVRSARREGDSWKETWSMELRRQPGRAP